VRITAPVIVAIGLWSASAEAHHEALFGPQSSLAVESRGFVSLQMHVKNIGTGASFDREAVYILSAGVTPIEKVPLSFVLVQPFTNEVAHSPTTPSVGPLAQCTCFARENLLIGTSYRFDYTGLAKRTGKDGNFALVSASFEPPTGEKEGGTWNGIAAAMTAFEWGHFAAVGLVYYRINGEDGMGTKKWNNTLLGGGFAYTPIDRPNRMVSFQLGVGAEIHERDVLAGTEVDRSGGWELLASPTIVWSPAHRFRFFALVSLPFVQNYRSDAQEDRWRAGLGIIYSFWSAH
jgi:hypothetical protein